MRLIFYIIVSVFFISEAFCQDSNHSFGGNIGYGGGDGVSPDYTYDIFYGYRLGSKVKAKLGYYKGDAYIEDRFNQIDNFLSSKWVDGDNTSKKPIAEFSLLGIYSLGLEVKINSHKSSSLCIIPYFMYTISSQQKITSWSSNFLGFIHERNKSFGGGLELQYQYLIKPKIGLNASAYAYGVGSEGPGQVGGKVGFEIYF
ncbi:MAG TPA: hypothetical protein VK169_19985 [Saprospiraceae bacterium]|nr:hypothetical protein [Saprospiraceae bacterium]